MELAAVQTDASEFLRGIAELFKPLADQLQIQFSQEIPNDPLILWIDRRKWRSLSLICSTTHSNTVGKVQGK